VLTKGTLTGVDIQLEPVSSTPAPAGTPMPSATVTPAIPRATAALTGTVTFSQGVTLDANTVVKVQLLDVSGVDAPAEVIGEQSIPAGSQSTPIAFALPYDPGQIDQTHYYLLLATITVDGNLKWINNQARYVLTYGNPAQGVDVIVQPVQ
jgi:uncharacterized lipoprotein YbaY